MAGWILTVAPPGPASISTLRPGARGWEGGISQRGGSRVLGQPAGPFCLRRERGNGKGGEEASVGCAALGPVQTRRVRGPQRSGPHAADPPASGPPPALGKPARLAPAGWPPAAHRARVLGGRTEHSGNRVWDALSVFRGRPTWMPGGSHSEAERVSHWGDTRVARCTQIQLESTLRKAAGRCGLTAPPSSSFFPDPG